jgi:hypothetical protein
MEADVMNDGVGSSLTHRRYWAMGHGTWMWRCVELPTEGMIRVHISCTLMVNCVRTPRIGELI